MKTLIKDERTVDVAQLKAQPHSQVLKLADTISYLASPDSQLPLEIAKNGLALTDSINAYAVADGIPILYPKKISDAFMRNGLELKYHEDTILQYFLLSQIKQRGEINSAAVDTHYQRHLYRMKDFLKDCRGTVLDVGCDNVDTSASLFNEHCKYIGLDPFSSSGSNFRIVGVGEYLPFRDNSIDNVVFNTSLDHILDHHSAIEEAQRVLKPGGLLFISTLIWTSKATLLSDAVHFHHFRDYEIFGAVSNMQIESIKNYQYKNDENRHGMYICASKHM